MRAIFFDLDGTLLHFTREYGDVLVGAITDAGVTADDATLESYDDAFYELFSACEPEPVRRAFERTGVDVATESLVEALRRHEVEMCRPPDGAAADLARLGERYRLGVLTNGVPEWQRHKLRSYGLDGHFDAFVASYEAGAHKPERAPFELAEKRLPADEYAMVGDADADIEGAERAGWTAHRYEEEGFGDLPDALGWA